MLCYAKSLQSCPTLCDPIDGSLPGSPVPGILQARTLEWVAISFLPASCPGSRLALHPQLCVLCPRAPRVCLSLVVCAPGLCPRVWVCLTVSLCLSVLCSWTLVRMEWYGFFVSSAHLGPILTPGQRPKVFSGALLGLAEAGLGLCPSPSLPVPPGGLSTPQALLRLWSPGLTQVWSEQLSPGPSLCREPSLWALGTGRSFRPR